jgi:heme A synthase
MERSRLHLYAILVASWTLLLIVTGAAVTSSPNQPRQLLFDNIHLAVALIEAVMTIGLVIWLVRTRQRAWLIRFAWVTLAAGIIEGAVADPRLLHALGSSSPAMGTLHACLAALLFTAFVVIALATSPAWQRDPEVVQDYGWPSLRSLSSAAAFLVAVQVGFGAAFRHNTVSVMPHLLGALLVALFIMIVGAFVTNQVPKHASLRPMAVRLMIVTSVQVVLGMAVFLLRRMGTPGNLVYLVISIAHVAAGNLTFASSTVLAIEIRRNVRPRK